eukprot:6471967-Prymnesium_polylepis.1
MAPRAALIVVRLARMRDGDDLPFFMQSQSISERVRVWQDSAIRIPVVQRLLGAFLADDPLARASRLHTRCWLDAPGTASKSIEGGQHSCTCDAEEQRGSH